MEERPHLELRPLFPPRQGHRAVALDIRVAAVANHSRHRLDHHQEHLEVVEAAEVVVAEAVPAVSDAQLYGKGGRVQISILQTAMPLLLPNARLDHPAQKVDLVNRDKTVCQAWTVFLEKMLLRRHHHQHRQHRAKWYVSCYSKNVTMTHCMSAFSALLDCLAHLDHLVRQVHKV